MAEYLTLLNFRKASKLSKDRNKYAISSMMVQLKVSLRDIQHEVARLKGLKTQVNDAVRRIRDAKE